MTTHQDDDRMDSWKNMVVELTLSDDPRSSRFREFCETLAVRIPAIRFQHREANDVTWPALSIGKNITCHALPLDNEFEPFLFALSDHIDDRQRISTSLRSRIETVTIPVFLKVFVSPGCPYCPEVLRRLFFLAKINTAITVTVIDPILFPELAEPYGVRSTPTTIMDDQFRWTGSVDLLEVCNAMISRDPSKLSLLSLINMFDEGNAAGAARIMINSGKVFPAFIEALTHDKWPVRLGAMVAFEILAEENRTLAAAVIDALWKVFSTVDDTVKGDILYLVGVSGCSAHLPQLKRMRESFFPEEVMEAVKEAIEKLDSR